MTNQQGAPEAPSYEHQRAIMEGERNASLDAYSRVVHLTQTESRIYEAAFTNGWNRLASLVDAQQPATHVQNPAEFEHVAGDVSKKGVESNIAQQAAPSAAAAQQSAACDKAPAGWLCIRQHGHDGPCAAEPTLSARSDNWVEGYAVGVMDGRADALRALQPSTTPQADSQPAPDPADIIAGALQISRWHAMELMQQAVDADRAARAPADSVLEDAARLDWLEQNLFHREKDEWDTKFGGYADYNMWVLFSPKGTQGRARDIIDAARKQGANHD